MDTVLYYSFLQSSHTDVKPLTINIDSSGELWEDIRYRLERKYGLHGSNSSGGRKTCPDSYLVGWYINPINFLSILMKPLWRETIGVFLKLEW